MDLAAKVARRFADQQDLPFAGKKIAEAAEWFYYVQNSLEEMHVKPLVDAAHKAFSDAHWDLDNGKVPADKVEAFVKKSTAEIEDKLDDLQSHLDKVAKHIAKVRSELK